MNNLWSRIRFAALLFALPLVATAAVSANQWISSSSPISIESTVVSAKPALFGAQRNHTIALDANGMVQGRVAALRSNPNDGLSNMQVYFVQNGEIVKQVMTTANGSFIVSGLQPGAYTFVASGDKGFAAYGMHIVSYGEKGGDMIEVAALTPMTETLRQIIDRDVQGALASAITQAGDAEGAPIVASNRVALVNGNLVGNLFAMSGQTAGPEVNVYLIQNDAEVASAKTDANGSFVIPNVAPGVYGFIACGRGMFGAVSMEVVSGGAEVPVAIQEGGALPMDGATLQLGSVGDVFIVREQRNDEVEFLPIEEYTEFAPMTTDGGYMAAPGGGYYSPGVGPGFAGGSRLGRLALLGGAVAGIVALANDGDAAAGSNVNPN